MSVIPRFFPSPSWYQQRSSSTFPWDVSCRVFHQHGAERHCPLPPQRHRHLLPTSPILALRCRRSCAASLSSSLRPRQAYPGLSSYFRWQLRILHATKGARVSPGLRSSPFRRPPLPSHQGWPCVSLWDSAGFTGTCRYLTRVSWP